MSWRYRYAWMSARARAARLEKQLAYMEELSDRQATRLHLAGAGRAELLDQLIAAGRTITELQAAIDIAAAEVQAAKGNPS